MALGGGGGGGGARTKPRSIQQDFSCADCGATDPTWASINRGILICDGCCSVHRSLGRHISQIKSLRKSAWHPALLTMVQSLHISGANHIWEHALLDPSSAKVLRRKPQPKDPIHPNKADFIRAKHQLMSFVYRPSATSARSGGGGGGGSEEGSSPHLGLGGGGPQDRDTSRQLHASVRTANLETSLRLLTLGADPNYYNEEKGNFPLHVAATAGQSSQVELLVTHGADPGSLDRDGLTPIDCARDEGFPAIAERLVELQYELTDRLTFYLCGKRPDHAAGGHWIIPELADHHRHCSAAVLNDTGPAAGSPSFAPTSSDGVAREARSRLVSLPNHSFEDLACDLYDEVDRRETDAVWLSLQNQSALLSDRCSVPFLPVNPEFSATRNQGRQKLARFNARELATVIIDLLVEARRRTTPGGAPQPQPQPPSPLPPTRERDKKDGAASLSKHGFPPLVAGGGPQSRGGDRQASSSGRSNGVVAPFRLHKSGPPVGVGGASPPPPEEGEGEEEPLYDSVASEDDYSYSWGGGGGQTPHQPSVGRPPLRRGADDGGGKLQADSSYDYQEIVDGVGERERRRDGSGAVSVAEYLEMKRHLEVSETRIKELMDSNVVMSAKLEELSTMIHALKEENDSLRLRAPFKAPGGGGGPAPAPYYAPTGPGAGRTFPPQLYEESAPIRNGGDFGAGAHNASNGGTKVNALSQQSQRPYSMFESRGGGPPLGSVQSTAATHHHHHSTPREPHRGSNESFRNAGSLSRHQSFETASGCSDPSPVALPSQDEVVLKTETITKRIQELLLSAQDADQEGFLPCSHQIGAAVGEMARLFPPKSECPADVWSAVEQLVLATSRLQGEVRSHATSQLHLVDPGRATQEVIQCAYDIAKAAKCLVTHFQ